MSHSHQPHEHDSSVRVRTPAVLIAIVVPLAVLTVVGLIALWPDGNGPQDPRLDATYGTPGSSVVQGTLVELDRRKCQGEHRHLSCPKGVVRLDSGRRVPVDLPPGSDRAGAQVDDRVRLVHARVGPAGEKTDYFAFVDFVRDVPMIWLAILYAGVVVAVARFRGLRAILGLVVAFAVLIGFMLPALLEGKPPVLVGIVGAAAIMLVVLYFAHGFSARTTTALLGTFAGLVVTALLGALSAGAARLTGVGSEESLHLQAATGSLDLSAVLLCGVVLAGLGILNDVTITQASAVWELHAVSPELPARRLFSGAMRIGRDHIASTVYTIAFAYAGAALPVLLLLELYQRPFVAALTSGELAEEVVRTLVGSIGLVLAIPLTTAIGVLVVKTARPAIPAEPANVSGPHGPGSPAAQPPPLFPDQDETSRYAR